MTANFKTASHNKQAEIEGQCCLKLVDLFTSDCVYKFGIVEYKVAKAKAKEG